MKKMVLVLALLSSISSNAQFIIDNTFQPESFSEMLAPFLIYKQAYERAEEQFISYFNKAKESIESRNYSMAKTYLIQCQQLNKRFNGELCSSKELSQWIEYCDNQIKYQEAFGRAVEQFNTNLNKAKECIDSGNFSMGKYFLTNCRQINDNFDGNICSRNDLFLWISYCDEQMEFQKRIIAYNNSLNMTNGVQYQTVNDNESCRITKVSANKRYTTIEFDYTNLYDEGGWCNISPTTFIVDKTTGKKLKLLWAEGIPKSPKKYLFRNIYDILHFKLVFPAVSTKTTIIDMIESNDSSWRFYNIKIR